MSYTLADLPRDDDGIIIGKWRVRHETPSFEGGLGGAEPVNFVKGVADRPLGGWPLHQLMCAMGTALTCEPWEGEVAKPAPDTRRTRGVGPTSKESLMPRQEREAVAEDRRAAAAKAAVADAEKRAQFSGLVPQTPAHAHAEIARLRHPPEPDETRPNIIGDAEPAKAAEIVAPVAENENQRAVLEMLEDAGEDVAALRDLAGEVGIKVDRRWRSERLRMAIQEAAQKVVAPGDGLDEIEDMDILRSMAEGLGIDAEEFDSVESLRVEIRRVRADGD